MASYSNQQTKLNHFTTNRKNGLIKNNDFQLNTLTIEPRPPGPPPPLVLPNSNRHNTRNHVISVKNNNNNNNNNYDSKYNPLSSNARSYNVSMMDDENTHKNEKDFYHTTSPSSSHLIFEDLNSLKSCSTRSKLMARQSTTPCFSQNITTHISQLVQPTKKLNLSSLSSSSSENQYDYGIGDDNQSTRTSTLTPIALASLDSLDQLDNQHIQPLPTNVTGRNRQYRDCPSQEENYKNIFYNFFSRVKDDNLQDMHPNMDKTRSLSNPNIFESRYAPIPEHNVSKENSSSTGLLQSFLHKIASIAETFKKIDLYPLDIPIVQSEKYRENLYGENNCTYYNNQRHRYYNSSAAPAQTCGLHYGSNQSPSSAAISRRKPETEYSDNDENNLVNKTKSFKFFNNTNITKSFSTKSNNSSIYNSFLFDEINDYCRKKKRRKKEEIEQHHNSNLIYRQSHDMSNTLPLSNSFSPPVRFIQSPQVARALPVDDNLFSPSKINVSLFPKTPLSPIAVDDLWHLNYSTRNPVSKKVVSRTTDTTASSSIASPTARMASHSNALFQPAPQQQSNRTGSCCRNRSRCSMWELCQPVRCVVDQNEVEIIPANTNRYRNSPIKEQRKKRSSLRRKQFSYHNIASYSEL